METIHQTPLSSPHSTLSSPLNIGSSELSDVRYNWTHPELTSIYTLPFPELLFKAHCIHRKYFDPTEIQRSTLLSIKTGGCPENCKYCPQSAHYDTGIEKHKLLPINDVVEKAKNAKMNGATRFCMGAAWREIRDGKEFEEVLNIVNAVHKIGLEVCCTMGMLKEHQAKQLKEAGCYAYNHNLDTSPEYYGSIITTRTYEERLQTLKNVRNAGMTVCCGGIVGLGESVDDRVELLRQLTLQNPHPESVPLNVLVRVEGTPLEQQKDIDPLDFVRLVATARIALPKSRVRLSAGRNSMSDELQSLCFFAGANSLFSGEKLLTTENPDVDTDNSLVERLGMHFL
jgi:biotin synthase